MSCRPRLSDHSSTITTTEMMNIVSSVELMLTWKVTRLVLGAALSRTQTGFGAGNSRLPLMKQTGNAQVRLSGASLSYGGNSRNARTSTTITKISSSPIATGLLMRRPFVPVSPDTFPPSSRVALATLVRPFRGRSSRTASGTV